MAKYVGGDITITTEENAATLLPHVESKSFIMFLPFEEKAQ